MQDRERVTVRVPVAYDEHGQWFVPQIFRQFEREFSDVPIYWETSTKRSLRNLSDIYPTTLRVAWAEVSFEVPDPTPREIDAQAEYDHAMAQARKWRLRAQTIGLGEGAGNG